MRVTIRSPHVPLTDTDRDYISDSIKHALAHVDGRVTSVQVHLADQNGPKGGLDLQCDLVANCGQLGIVRTEAREMKVRAAVDTATTKLRRAVEHAVDHKREVRKSSTPRRRTSK